MIGLFAISAALAEPGVPSKPILQTDRMWRTEVLIEAETAIVRSALADAETALSLSESVLGVNVLHRSGTCDLVEVTCKGVWEPLRYTIRRCATVDGFEENLVASEDFSAERAVWHLEAVPGGTRVSFALDSQTRLPIPRPLLEARMRSSAVETLVNLAELVSTR